MNKIIVALIALVSTLFSVGLPLFYKMVETHKENHYINFEGIVKNGLTGEPVPDAEITFMERPTIILASTDSKGVFSCRLEKSYINQTVRIKVSHKNFKSWNIYRAITSQSKIEEIILEPISITYNVRPLIPKGKPIGKSIKEPAISTR